MTTPSTPDAPAVNLADEIDGGAIRINPTPAEQVRVIVAWIGDDPITVPKVLPGNLVFNSMRVYRRTMDAKVMVTWMVEEALGPEQTAKLSNCDGMTPQDFKNLLEKIGKLYQGQVDELLGN